VFVFQDDEEANPLAPIFIVSKTGFQFDWRDMFCNNGTYLPVFLFFAAVNPS